MLKTQILAAEVCNLTDARYFAAWGVDYISFNCNRGEENFIEQSSLLEIKDWIEGPKFLAYFNGLDDPSSMEEMVSKLSLQGMVLGPFTPENSIKAIDAENLFKEFVSQDVEGITNGLNSEGMSAIGLQPIIKTSKNTIADYFDKEVLLDVTDLDIAVVKEIINESKCGLVLRGGEEEKVGLKSFDFLDDVFDLLMD